MFFTARSTSSVTQSSTTGFQTPSIMKTSRQQTSQSAKDKSTFSQEASLASLSARQGSDLVRTMTATSGLRCYESSGRYSPLSSLVRTLLASSRWYSPAKRLRWEAQPLSSTRTTTFTRKNSSSSSKQSAQTLSVKDTPSSRLLFRLVPSVRPTSETECGSSQEGMFPHLLLTPCTREFCEDPASMRARAKRNGYKNGTKYNSLLSQVVYSDILPTPVTQGLKVCQDGKQKFLSLGLLPTPLAVEIQHSKRIKALKEKGGMTMGSRANGEQRPNGLMDFINFHGMLLTPSASDGMRAMMTMDNLKAHRKKNSAQTNLPEQIAHNLGGGTS